MSKYQLIAAHYNLYTGKYENEQVITIPGINLTSLIEIDKFTSSHTTDELFKIIKEHNQINEETNALSIRYCKLETYQPIYYKTIIDNKIIESVLKNLYLTYFPSRGRYSYGIKRSNENFCLEEKKIIELIENKKINELDELFKNNAVLKHLIHNYLESDYDNEDARLEDLSKIIIEFGRYKTFRGWIVANLKKNLNKYTNKKKEKVIIKPKRKLEVKTIEQYESEFEDKFKRENNISYQSQAAMNYNIRNLDDDKEEFIEPDELEQMGYTK